MSEDSASRISDLIKTASVPVVLDFYTDACPPCKILGPKLQKMVEDYSDKIVFVKINGMNEPDVCAEHGVRTVPTVKIFHKGEKVEEFHGITSDARIRAKVDELLAAPLD